MFLILMVIGLAGLAVEAVAVLARHGWTAHARIPAQVPAFAHGYPHAPRPTDCRAGAIVAHAHGAAAPPCAPCAPAASLAGAAAAAPEVSARRASVHGLPGPRAAFTSLALFGAVGHMLHVSFELSTWLAALLAAVLASFLQRFAVAPLLSHVGRRRDSGCPLEALLRADARAVVPFRNGRGVVSIIRGGRILQVDARLCASQTTAPVRVGDRVRVEQVDVPNEQVTVSLVHSR